MKAKLSTKPFKKIMSLTLALLFLFEALPFTLGTVKVEAYTDYWIAEKNDGSAVIEQCYVRGSKVVIPSTINGYIVKGISGGAFESDEYTEIVIPDSVSSISRTAFIYCNNLKTITVSNENQFYSSDSSGVLYNKDKSEIICFPRGASLTSFTVPSTVKKVNYYTFYSSENLSQITFSEGVQRINRNAIYDCHKLETINIPSSVTMIDEGFVSNSENLKAINVSSSSDSYYSENGILYNKSKTQLLLYPIQNTLSTFSVPSSVVQISYHAFAGTSNLAEITIPDSVRSIEKYAFENSAVKKVNGGKGISEIKDGTFLRCKKLESITIPNGVTAIGGSAFKYCECLTSITIPDSVTSIGSYAFENCEGLTSITIPDSVTSIGGYAFLYCTGLTSVNISNSVTSIGSGAFKCCFKLASISYKGTLESLGESAFSDTAFYENRNNWSGDVFVFGNFLVTVDAEKMGTSYTVPDSIKGIVGRAFNNCENLETITLNNYIKSIESNTFFGCSSLKKVVVGNNVTKIGPGAFHNCESLESINLPNKLSRIDDSAFQGCQSLKNITFPQTLEEIGMSAFYNCTSLSNVNLPDSVTVIEYSAFCGCEKLADIHIPENVKKIGGAAFIETQYYDDASKWDNGSLYINGKLITAENNSSEYYFVQDGVTFVADEAFIANNARVITLPEGMSKIGERTFKFCKSEEIYIPASVTLIEIEAFNGCYNLKDVYYCGSESQWKNITIEDDNYMLDEVNIHYNASPLKVYTISFNFNGASGSMNSVKKVDQKKITIPANIPSRTGYTFAGWSTNPQATTAQYQPGGAFNVDADTVLYAVWSKIINIYNLGEETYSFSNYGDDDSVGGHCFGMSSTSSGYYIGALDSSKVGVSLSNSLYSLQLQKSVKDPICYYQQRQGIYSYMSIVAGGCSYLSGYSNIGYDWNEVISYVSNHNYDGKGNLQVGFRKDGEGGHAVNFIRYDVINGQQRIYVYDNNFPNTETYFYKGSDGNVYQYPQSTFSGSIDCIALRDMNIYFTVVSGFDSTRYFYAKADSIDIPEATKYLYDCGTGSGEYVMFEVPDTAEHVTINPLCDNAEFRYCNNDYEFKAIGEDTYGDFTLAKNESTAQIEAGFSIKNEPNGFKLIDFLNWIIDFLTRCIDFISNLLLSL